MIKQTTYAWFKKTKQGKIFHLRVFVERSQRPAQMEENSWKDLNHHYSLKYYKVELLVFSFISMDQNIIWDTI
jgi:hypothetical protein